MINSASQYLSASDKQKQTDTHRAHTLENTDHTYKSKAHAVTDKALCRCTFCVIKNNMSQAATADRAIQNRYLNAVTTQSSSEARSQNGGILTRRQKQCADESTLSTAAGARTDGECGDYGKEAGCKTCERGCLLGRQASETGAEATMCPVNMAEEPDWLLQTRLEWKEVCVCRSLLCV